MRIEPFKIEDFPLLAEGEAQFQIIEAEDVVSKKASNRGIMEPDQLRIKFRVWDKDGKEGTCMDYFPYDLTWKLGKILESIGLERLAQTGDIDPLQFSSRAGKCFLETSEYEGKKRTSISYYLKKSKPDQMDNNFDNFDIPL